MRLQKIIAILLCTLFMFGCSREPVFHDTQGKDVKLSQLHGKWVIVNYWATWCHSCAAEIPALNHFYQDAKDKNILLYGVNFDESGTDALGKSIEKEGIIFPVLTENPAQAWNFGELSAVPMTFIINPKGELVKTISGPNTEKSLFDNLSELQKSYLDQENAKTS